MDPEMQWFIGGVFVVVMLMAGFWIWYGGRRADAVRCRRFAEREEILFEEFINAVGEQERLDRDLVMELLHDLSEEIGVSPGKLRVEDRFDVELAPQKGWERDDGIYVVLDEWDTLQSTDLRSKGLANW